MKPEPATIRQLPDSIFSNHETRIGQDLRLNLLSLLEHSALSPDESALALLALSTSVGLDSLAHYARERLAELSVSRDEMQEAAESAAHMAMLNVYYSARHYLRADDEEYGPPNLRMSVLMSPKIGKRRFDMLAFALSVLNGCEPCVVGHERALRRLGVSVEKLHDLVRLASVVNALKILSTS